MSTQEGSITEVRALKEKAAALGIQTMIVIIQGPLGSGKTLLLNFFVQNFVRKGIPVYTDYRAKGSMPLEQLMKVRDLDCAVVAIDDAIREGLDSYGQMGKGSRLATKMLRFVRKRHLVIMMTQQIATGIAKRVRHIANYVFEVERIKFPCFRVRGYLPSGVRWLDTGIRFKPGVYNSYDTDEVVTDDISLEKLTELYQVTDKSKISSGKTVFKYLVTAEYGIPLDLSAVLYECIRDANYEALEMLTNYWGYELV